MASNTPTTNPPPRFAPSPHECEQCNQCTQNTPCPSTDHPYNLSGEANLQCYTCSACSHGFTVPRNAQNAQTVWYVHIPMEDKSNSEIMYYRVALASIANSKASIYPNENDLPEDDNAVVIPVQFAGADPAMIMKLAGEKLKTKLRGLKHLYDFEMHLGVTN